jgi:hypothetical protein
MLTIFLQPSPDSKYSAEFFLVPLATTASEFFRARHWQLSNCLNITVTDSWFNKVLVYQSIAPFPRFVIMPQVYRLSSPVKFCLRLQSTSITYSTMSSSIMELLEIFDGKGAFIFGMQAYRTTSYRN